MKERTNERESEVKRKLRIKGIKSLGTISATLSNVLSSLNRLVSHCLFVLFYKEVLLTLNATANIGSNTTRIVF